MKKAFVFVAAFTTLATVGTAFMPAAEAKTKVIKKKISVSAIPGRDERDINDPTTRCLTTAMKALNATAIRKMNADIAKYPGHDAAAATYRESLEIIWSAMEQPYCGFGSRGLTAVKRSFQKSVDHARDAFLRAVK